MRAAARLGRGGLLLSAAVLLPACGALAPSRADPAPVVRGPLALRTNGPLVQEFLTLRPRRAATAPVGGAELRVLTAYSSIFEQGSGAGGSVTFDGELWRTSASLRAGLSERTDVEAELAVLYATSGFLDVFIESWHALLNLPSSGREARDEFDYTMRAEAGGTTIYELEGNELGLCDLPVVLTQRVVDESADTPGVALRAGVELPTGDESSGFGNGALDWGLGLVAERSLGRCTLGGSLSWTDRGAPSAFQQAGVGVQDGLAAGLWAEVRWDDVASLLAGVRYESAVTEDLGLEEIGGDVLEIDVGLARDVGQASRLVLALSDDALAQSGPDFTVSLGFETGF